MSQTFQVSQVFQVSHSRVHYPPCFVFPDSSELCFPHRYLDEFSRYSGMKVGDAIQLLKERTIERLRDLVDARISLALSEEFTFMTDMLSKFVEFPDDSVIRVYGDDHACDESVEGDGYSTEETDYDDGPDSP